MQKIFALFNTENKIVKIGLALNNVTSHMDRKFPTKIWNALFKADDADEQKRILKSIGYNVKEGVFKEDCDCTGCKYDGGLKVDCIIPSLTPCPSDMQNDITYPGSIE